MLIKRDTLKKIFSRKAVNAALAGALFAGAAGMLAHQIYDGRLGDELASAAAGNGQTWLLSSMDAIGVDVVGNSDDLLYHAAVAGHRETVQWIVGSGRSSAEARNEALVASAQEGHADVVIYLLDMGIDVHTQADGALFAAAANNRNDVVDILLDRGADPRAITDVGPRCQMVQSLSSEETKSSLGFVGCRPQR